MRRQLAQIDIVYKQYAHHHTHTNIVGKTYYTLSHTKSKIHDFMQNRVLVEFSMSQQTTKNVRKPRNILSLEKKIGI